jgi:hypothetical protein
VEVGTHPFLIIFCNVEYIDAKVANLDANFLTPPFLHNVKKLNEELNAQLAAATENACKFVANCEAIETVCGKIVNTSQIPVMECIQSYYD